MLKATVTKRSITSRDVAQRVGVSQAAVSYAFSPRPEKRALVSAQTRAQILEVAEALGYLPNAGARGMKSGKSGLVALWVPNFENSTYLRTMGGMQAVAAAQGLDLLVYGGTGARGMEGVLRSMGERRVDGAILIARPLAETAKATLRQLEVPLVTMGGSLRYEGIDAVLTRNAEAFEQMVRWLAQKGYQRIGHISGPLGTPTAQERLEGFKRGLRRAGLPFRKAWLREGTYRAGNAGGLALELLRSESPPDALVVANDLMAVEAILALRDQGYRVPHDLAIVGCDDIPEAEVVRPRLTTIRRPRASAATAAFELLLERMNGYAGKARVVWQDAELVIRESA